MVRTSMKYFACFALGTSLCVRRTDQKALFKSFGAICMRWAECGAVALRVCPLEDDTDHASAPSRSNRMNAWVGAWTAVAFCRILSMHDGVKASSREEAQRQMLLKSGGPCLLHTFQRCDAVGLDVAAWLVQIATIKRDVSLALSAGATNQTATIADSKAVGERPQQGGVEPGTVVFSQRPKVIRRAGVGAPVAKAADSLALKSSVGHALADQLLQALELARPMLSKWDRDRASLSSSSSQS